MCVCVKCEKGLNSDYDEQDYGDCDKRVEGLEDDTKDLIPAQSWVRGSNQTLSEDEVDHVEDNDSNSDENLGSETQ